MRGENHAWCTDTALGSTVFKEALLNGMHSLISGQSFNAGYLSAFSLQRWNEAGVDELPVEDDGTGSTFTFSATLFGSGEMEIFAQDIQKAFHGLGFDGLAFTIDGKADGGHTVVSLNVKVAVMLALVLERELPVNPS